MKYFIIIFLIFITFVSCKKEEEVHDDDFGWCQLIPIDIPCGVSVVQDSLRYDSITNTFFTLSNVDVTNDCLRFQLTASGCSGDSWNVNVVDAQTLSYTNPISKDLKVEFKNNEICTAVFTKAYNFDLAPLQEVNDSVLNLNFINSSISVLYNY